MTGFRMVLAGARPGPRLLAALGAMLGIAAAGLLCASLPLDQTDLPSMALLVAPMGASAVLIFAVPASPLAQPWAVIGGNVISAAVGVTVVQFLGVSALSAGVAVGCAVLVMSLCRCLHPPGGAAALLAVVGGPVVIEAGYWFVAPVAANAAALLAAGWLFHRVSGRSYPHRPAANPATPPTYAPGLHRRDIDAALADLGETFDIDPDDLDLLMQTAEQIAAARQKA
ncbi:HPP family protein [Polymorphobacter sp.]|uniref:HPP family protein n=1 Tax=Polymorphobacter sp. TaxID=1909290 RepID=UPI003F7028D6